MPLYDLRLTDRRTVRDVPGNDATHAAQCYVDQHERGTGIGVIATRPARSGRLLIGTYSRRTRFTQPGDAEWRS